ncbi:MAG: UDP-N-acetylmuramate dehydrogenase [Opitutales bacterium]|jgi:UDP-N-acetylmuramate dehydrogenase
MTGEPKKNVPLAPLTTWKIGGPAEWFWAPADEAELVRALQWAKENGQRVHVLGRGSNVLVSDSGLKGLVIYLRELAGDETRVIQQPDGFAELEVPAGLSLPRLSKVVAQMEYGGYEFYIGIPGTVGGAVTVNAGYGPGDERQTANRCTAVRTVSLAGDLQWRPYADFNPVYRHSDLMHSNRVVTAARFALRERSTREAIRAETARHLAMRHERQPLTRPTAGSVFKGTAEEVPAAVYIDRCGLKGLRVGGAVVSTKHANWIENTGNAKAADVLALIDQIREVVSEREGIELEAEVRILR